MCDMCTLLKYAKYAAIAYSHKTDMPNYHGLRHNTTSRPTVACTRRVTRCTIIDGHVCLCSFHLSGVHIKTALFDCEWGVDDDSRLLRGVYDHGLGNWDTLKMDDDLQLHNKVGLVAYSICRIQIWIQVEFSETIHSVHESGFANPVLTRIH